jgi:hypothetical protein
MGCGRGVGRRPSRASRSCVGVAVSAALACATPATAGACAAAAGADVFAVAGNADAGAAASSADVFPAIRRCRGCTGTPLVGPPARQELSGARPRARAGAFAGAGASGRAAPALQAGVSGREAGPPCGVVPADDRLPRGGPVVWARSVARLDGSPLRVLPVVVDDRGRTASGHAAGGKHGGDLHRGELRRDACGGGAHARATARRASSSPALWGCCGITATQPQQVTGLASGMRRVSMGVSTTDASPVARRTLMDGA